MFLSVIFLHNIESQAVSTNFFRQSSFVGFGQGEKNNVSLTSDGIKLSPEVNRVRGIDESYVWCLTKDEYGNVYIGAGDPASVYKLSPTGGLVLLHRFEELYAQSLAVSPSGHIFVGTSPQGIIYKITPWRDVVMVCDLPDSYVWKLQFDNAGRLYAATGPEGRIYRISEDGDATVFFDSPQSHILDIAVDKEDNLYTCSEPDGLIYKITSGGKPFVIYDVEESEVHCLAIDSTGNLYAGTASGARPQLPAPPLGPPIKPSLEPLPPTEIVPPVEVNIPQQVPLPTPQLRSRPRIKPGYMPPPYGRIPQAPNVVYKITPDGIIKRILAVESGYVFALCTDENDNTYAATANKAGLYLIDRDENVSTLLEPEESQILSLLFTTQRGLLFGTGNKGCLYELSRAYAEKGILESSVFDAEINSTWGNISWDADVPEGTDLSVATRTGNSEKPDDTWSEWSVEHTSGEKTGNPPSRFIQYRATLSTTLSNATPLLKHISIAYLPKNQPPEITSLTVDGSQTPMPGRAAPFGPPTKQTDMRMVTTGKIPKKPPQAGRAPSAGTKLIAWQVSDPNRDNTSFTLYYRGIRERNWKVLQKETQKSSYVWQTTRVPDGEYVVKLLATDKPDNPPEVALNTEKTSQSFIIDNTRPRLTSLSVSALGREKASAEGAAVDELSDISRLQYSVDAGDWVSIFPEDRIFDAKEESFHFSIESLGPGEHTLVINATDNEGNIGSGKALIELSD